MNKKTSPYLLMHRYTHKIPNYKPMVAEPIILIYAEIMDCRISVLFLGRLYLQEAITGMEKAI